MSIIAERPPPPCRTLLATPELTVADYLCSGSSPDSDERIEWPEIVFVRSGSFRVESSLGERLADPTQVVFLPGGESARFSHPGRCRDRSFFVSLAPAVLRELLEEVRPAANDRSRTPFEAAVPCLPRWFEGQRRLRERLLAREDPADSLEATESALQLVAETLAGPSRKRSAGEGAKAKRQRQERVEATQVEISRRLDRSLALSQLGRRVGVSGYRLAREFRVETGWSIHQYRLGLRLHAAAERLADGERDLTGLALELGFADHAHFSNSFRRRFGVQPSAYRRSFSLPQNATAEPVRQPETRSKTRPK